MATDNSNTRLGVNRTSGKITKKTNAIPRPAPKIYKIHPSSFRNLVQELTGKDFEPATLLQPKPESPMAPLPSPPQAFNSRLQRFAPPPLDSGGVSDGAAKFDFFSLSPMPILSPGMFSPLTSFTPMDWKWPEDAVSASPASLEYTKLAQNFLEQREKSFEEPNYLDSPSAFRQNSWQDSNTKPFAPAVSSSGGLGSPVSYLRFSPRCGSLSPTFALPSPSSFAGFDLGTI